MSTVTDGLIRLVLRYLEELHGSRAMDPSIRDLMTSHLRVAEQMYLTQPPTERRRTAPTGDEEAEQDRREAYWKRMEGEAGFNG